MSDRCCNKCKCGKKEEQPLSDGYIDKYTNIKGPMTEELYEAWIKDTHTEEE